jgi:hypothetical protein
VAGVGLNNKHAVAFLLLAVLVALLADRHSRPALRTPWPWIAGGYAALLWVPNLVWQWRHDWPVLDLSADNADEYGGLGGRLGLVGEAAVMFSPFIGVLAVVGGAQLLRREEWRSARLPAFVFVVVTLVFLVTGGKGYYLAGAMVPLVAAGATWLAPRLSSARLGVAAAALAASAMVAWPALVPVLPAQAFADSFYTALNDDQVETIGWEDHAATVQAVVETTSPRAVVLTANYGEAGAFEWYGVEAAIYSGHNGWRFFGRPADDGRPVVVVGLDPRAEFVGCEIAATLQSEVEVDNEENGRPVWVCDEPARGWDSAWDRLVRYSA